MAFNQNGLSFRHPSPLQLALQGAARAGREVYRPPGLLEKPIVFTQEQRQLQQQLFEGCREGDLEKVRGALDKGAIVNDRYHWWVSNKDKTVFTDASGLTVLMFAFAHGPEAKRYDIVKLLIERGADVNATVELHGGPKSVLAFALSYGYGKIAALLRENGAEITEQVKSAYLQLFIDACSWVWRADYIPSHQRLENVEEALKSGVDANTIIEKDGVKKPALVLVLEQGEKEIAALLKEHGATITDEHARSAYRQRCFRSCNFGKKVDRLKSRSKETEK